MTRHESLPEMLEAVPNTEGRQSSYEEMRGFQMSARVLAAATPVLKAMDSGGSAYQIAYTAICVLRDVRTVSGWIPYHKLTRQQLLTLAIALEKQRDRALGRLADVWDEGFEKGSGWGEWESAPINPEPDATNPYRISE